MGATKFRAWDKRNKEYFYNVGIHPSIIRWEDGYGRNDPGALTVSPLVDIYDIEQYTGLKGMRGKEIYEGDIVLMSDESYILPSQKAVIEYSFGIPMARPLNDRFYVGNIHELCRDRLGNYKPKHGISGKIIGNVHENPELLK